MGSQILLCFSVFFSKYRRHLFGLADTFPMQRFTNISHNPFHLIDVMNMQTFSMHSILLKFNANDFEYVCSAVCEEMEKNEENYFDFARQGTIILWHLCYSLCARRFAYTGRAKLCFGNGLTIDVGGCVRNNIEGFKWLFYYAIPKFWWITATAARLASGFMAKSERLLLSSFWD